MALLAIIFSETMLLMDTKTAANIRRASASGAIGRVSCRIIREFQRVCVCVCMCDELHEYTT